MSVFISYRRAGGGEVAGAVYEALSRDYNVFLDTESLRSGPYEPEIMERLEECTDFLLITNATLFDRCNEPGDWIYREVLTALETHKNVIPIFVGIGRFPDNVPAALAEVCKQNGIFWDEDEAVIRKIRSFLLSNGRLTLQAVKAGGRIGLSQQSRTDLRALFEKNVNRGTLPVEVDVELSDPDGIALLMVDEELAEKQGFETAFRVARETMMRRYSWNRKPLSFAIERMLTDELLSACALCQMKRYSLAYGIQNCAFTDANGGSSPLWTYFLWVEIIEELFDELRENRNVKCADRKKYKYVDGVITHKGHQIWDFLTFVERKGEEEGTTFLDVPGPCADYYDIPQDDLASRVYPDFYYNLGMLQAGMTAYSYEKISRFPNVFDLTRYRFGPH